MLTYKTFEPIKHISLKKSSHYFSVLVYSTYIDLRAFTSTTLAYNGEP